jgi:hypothetical protein
MSLCKGPMTNAEDFSEAGDHFFLGVDGGWWGGGWRWGGGWGGGL